MEPGQHKEPVRHFTCSADQRVQVINFQFKYLHPHSWPHRHPLTDWLHVYKSIYRNLCVGWVIKVQTPFSTDRRGDRGYPATAQGWLPKAWNDIREIDVCRAIFSIFEHMCHCAPAEGKTLNKVQHEGCVEAMTELGLLSTNWWSAKSADEHPKWRIYCC